MNFVFVSLQPIDTGRDSTSTGLAKELAKNHKVLYVNPPIDRKAKYIRIKDQYLKKKLENRKNKQTHLKQLNQGLWMLEPQAIMESINWLPSTTLFKKLNWINNKRFAKDISSALQKLNFDQFILINDKDIFRSFYLKELLKPQRYIYLDRDYTLGVNYWKKHGTTLEPELMRKSDAVVCNSPDFTDRAKKFNLNSFYIGNGFNAEQYDVNKKRPIPKDLINIPGIRIGFVGAMLSLRLDLGLLIFIARSKPEWNFVLIGRQDEAFQQSELHNLPNVYFLGEKDTMEVPGYLEYFDVCINPQSINEITSGNFPLKIVEYLAMGKPVVATITNTMKQVFLHHTYLAGNKNEFMSQIERALTENTDQKKIDRILFAKTFSWEKVTDNLIQSIKKYQLPISK
jgi:teichuronic acid biosynthesis glycosyltransferase TuaH